MPNGKTVSFKTVIKKQMPPAMPKKASSLAHPEVANKEAVVEQWELDPELNLTTFAAKFYLLYDLAIDGQDEGRFKPCVDFLTDQFSSYTDMAVGGELRHMRGKYTPKKYGSPLAQALWKGHIPSSRSEAWAAWMTFRLRHGDVALDWAQTAFNTHAGGGYGGKKGANIAKVLAMFKRGELRRSLFVETCWGLEHNGGCYFNKVWSSYQGLKHVLDLNKNGHVASLLQYADTTGAYASLDTVNAEWWFERKYEAVFAEATSDALAKLKKGVPLEEVV